MEPNTEAMKAELDSMTNNIPATNITQFPSSNENTIRGPKQTIRSECPANEHIKTISKNIDDIIQIAYNKGLEEGYIDGRKDGRIEIIDVITDVLERYKIRAEQETAVR